MPRPERPAPPVEPALRRSRLWIALVVTLAIVVLAVAVGTQLRSAREHQVWVSACRGLGGHVEERAPGTENPLLVPGSDVVDACVGPSGTVIDVE